MTYTSFRFFVLVAVLLLLYYVLPEKVRWLVLLAGNAVFYYFAASSRWNLLVFCNNSCTELSGRTSDRKGLSIREKGNPEKNGSVDRNYPVHFAVSWI